MTKKQEKKKREKNNTKQESITNKINNWKQYIGHRLKRKRKENEIDIYINPDVLGIVMEFADYKTKQSMAIVNKEWYTTFRMRIQPTETQYARALRSRYMKEASIHLFQRNIFPVSFQDNLPFRAFCRFGCEDIVGHLLNMPEVNPAAGNNRALRKAAKHGHYVIAKKLLQDPRVEASKQALNKACDHKHWSIVKLILQDPAIDPSTDNNALIQQASAAEQIDIVRMLLKDTRVNPAAAENRALRYAAYNGNHEVVRLLLDMPNVNPAAQNNSAFRRAVKRGHYHVVALLLNDKRVDPTDMDNFAYDYAQKHKLHNILQLLKMDTRIQQSLHLSPPPPMTTQLGNNKKLFHSRSMNQLSVKSEQLLALHRKSNKLPPLKKGKSLGNVRSVFGSFASS